MKPKNIKKRLDVRVKDYASMINAGSYEGKVQQRMETGGFRKPGSYKK